MTTKWILPDWSVSSRVKAFSTTRLGGVSRGPYQGLNLGAHVGDDIECVSQNRHRLGVDCCWLEQVHGNDCVELSNNVPMDIPKADSAYSRCQQRVCTVMTADCLPLLLTDTQGSFVAAIHCGWRGLQLGIIEQQLKLIPSPRQEIVAWMGPAISQQYFEVGAEVRSSFVAIDQTFSDAFISASSDNKFMADLYALATMQLNKLGVTNIFGGEYCTYSQSDLFYSYRRDGQTGRMATCIWID